MGSARGRTAAAPIIKLVHSIVAQAVQQGASDIHVNPEEGDTRVLFRVDGVLAPAATVRRMAMGVVCRIKIMADLDIGERRVPQDGRFALTVDGRRVDIRVVTLPLVYGEGAVMRILDKGVVVEGLESLGMQPPNASASARRSQAERRGARHGADGLGKVDDAVRRAERASTTASGASSPSRTRSSSGSPGSTRCRSRPRPASRSTSACVDAPRGPGRDHGRRDPRRGDRVHRHPGGADRPPRADHAARQRPPGALAA